LIIKTYPSAASHFHAHAYACGQANQTRLQRTRHFSSTSSSSPSAEDFPTCCPSTPSIRDFFLHQRIRVASPESTTACAGEGGGSVPILIQVSSTPPLQPRSCAWSWPPTHSMRICHCGSRVHPRVDTHRRASRRPSSILNQHSMHAIQFTSRAACSIFIRLFVVLTCFATEKLLLTVSIFCSRRMLTLTHRRPSILNQSSPY
jgi:hypothetical protein